MFVVCIVTASCVCFVSEDMNSHYTALAVTGQETAAAHITDGTSAACNKGLCLSVFVYEQ